MNRASAIILLSFGTMLVLYLFVPFVIAMMGKAITPQPNAMTLLQIIWAINPYFLVFGAAASQYTARMTGSLPWAWCIGSHMALSVLLVIFSAMILRRRARRDGETSRGGSVADAVKAPLATLAPLPIGGGFEAGIPDASRGQSAGLRDPIPLSYAAPQVKKPRPAREVSDNPILWRELRRPLMARRWQRITGVCIVGFMLAIVYVLLAINHGLDDSEAQGAWACIFNFLIAGIALVISSTAIAQEKESDTWTLMLAAPVGGRAFVWGKALGVARRLVWPMALVAGHFLIFAACGVITFAEALLAVWVIMSFNTIWIATGVYFSLRFDKVTFAVVANLMLAISAYLFVWGILAMLTDVDLNPRPQIMLSQGQGAPLIDPKWLNIGIWTLFGVVAAWWGLAVYLVARTARGAIGHFMVATLVFMVVLATFAVKMEWMSSRRLDQQVGWYAPYYYLGKIGRYHDGWIFEGYQRLQWWLPNGSNIEGAPAVLFFVLMVGVAHLVAAGAVLSLTAWKFSGLVGRAPQLHPLASADRRAG
jgi:hypothetical protein